MAGGENRGIPSGDEGRKRILKKKHGRRAEGRWERMPFFRFECIKNQFKKRNVTLQVRNPLCNDKEDRTAGRRASFPIFRRQKGSMTVEAALGLPMFLFFMFLMAFPIRVMDTRRQVQAGVEAAGEKIAKYAYFTTGLAGDDEPDFLEGLSEEALRIMVEHAAQESAGTDWAGGFSAAKSRIMEDGETVDLIVDYTVKLPFPVFFLGELHQQVRCIRRAWTGKAGPAAEDGGPVQGAETIVYVGRDGSRYHLSRTCHYLYNDMTAVAADRVDTLRSRDGRRYVPCAVCGEEAGDTVYVMPNGESFHSRRDCRAISAYVRAVFLKDVQDLGACSYCSAP